MGKVGLVQDVVVVEALGAETGGALVGTTKKLGRRSYSGCVMRSPAVLPLLAAEPRVKWIQPTHLSSGRTLTLPK
jgi:hypothetical protein